jgi:hypothetical protein
MSVGVPSKGDPPPGSPDGAPMDRDARLESLFCISSRVPSTGTPLLQVPLAELPYSECHFPETWAQMCCVPVEWELPWNGGHVSRGPWWGWPPAESPTRISASWVLLARFLAARLQFFILLRQSTMPTVSVSTSRFPQLPVPESNCSSYQAGVSSVPGERGLCPVASCGDPQYGRTLCLEPTLDFVLEFPFNLLEPSGNYTYDQVTWCPHCVYVFCTDLRTNSNLCLIKH